MKKAKKRRPRSLSFGGEEFLWISESVWGGEYVTVCGSLLPLSDIRKMRDWMERAEVYLKAKEQRGRK